MSAYQELTSPPGLASYVECLWVHRVGDGDGIYEQPVFPDGCIDIVAIGDEVMVAGPATRSTTLRVVPGTLTVGVRFRTGAAPALVGASAAELRDQDLALNDVWGRAGVRLAAQLVETPGWQARLGVMVNGVALRLDQARALDPVGIGVAAVLAERSSPVKELANDFGLSDRQLRRRVEEAVGYSPRMLARILRFQRFLQAARTSSAGRNLAGLAVDAGYSDQAHLTRESRELGGRPPGALLDWEARRLAT